MNTESRSSASLDRQQLGGIWEIRNDHSKDGDGKMKLSCNSGQNVEKQGQEWKCIGANNQTK